MGEFLNTEVYYNKKYIKKFYCDEKEKKCCITTTQLEKPLYSHPLYGSYYGSYKGYRTIDEEICFKPETKEYEEILKIFKNK